MRSISYFFVRISFVTNFARLIHTAMSTVTPVSSSTNIFFGPWPISTNQIFYESRFSFGIVNLKPIVPGHVLVIPKRVCDRLAGLSVEEVVDLYTSVHHIGPILEAHYGAQALNIAMQDGVAAGQSVPHVHCHILPRKIGDFKRNDDVYTEIENQKLNEVFDPNAIRRPRSLDEMTVESFQLRVLFPNNIPSFV